MHCHTEHCLVSATNIYTYIPINTRYFNNDITVVKGEDQFQFEILNKGYSSIRLVTKCCYSPILIDSPAYGGGMVGVLQPFLKSGAKVYSSADQIHSCVMYIHTAYTAACIASGSHTFTPIPPTHTQRHTSTHTDTHPHTLMLITHGPWCSGYKSHCDIPQTIFDRASLRLYRHLQMVFLSTISGVNNFDSDCINSRAQKLSYIAVEKTPILVNRVCVCR